MGKTHRMRENFINQLHKEFAGEIESINELILSCLECDEELVMEAGKYLISSGGKRIRPLLTILSSKFCGYRGDSDLKLAAATELIHAATLLHDDVVDSSLMRRFKPTVNSVWGNKAAILVGDFLFSESFKLMVSTKSIESLDTLSKASSIIAKGEVSQLSAFNSKAMISKDAYYKIIESKTAELFASAAKVGAIISSESSDVENLMYDYGKYLGLIFQVRDDILDYFSTSGQMGKNSGDDFFEGKLTLPVIFLYQVLNEEEKIFLHEIFTKDTDRSQEELSQIVNLMKNHKIEDILQQEISEIINKAKACLDKIPESNKYKDYLYELIDFASERES